METLYNYVTAIDLAIDTNRKRHIVGGLLLSIALLFAGLSVTIITVKENFEDEVAQYD